MIFSYAPKLASTIDKVLDFLHLSSRRPAQHEQAAQPRKEGKQQAASAAEAFEEIAEDNGDELIRNQQDGADLVNNDDARDYESDDHEWMDNNYFLNFFTI